MDEDEKMSESEDDIPLTIRTGEYIFKCNGKLIKIKNGSDADRIFNSSTYTLENLRKALTEGD